MAELSQVSNSLLLDLAGNAFPTWVVASFFLLHRNRCRLTSHRVKRRTLLTASCSDAQPSQAATRARPQRLGTVACWMNFGIDLASRSLLENNMMVMLP